jgi:ABC-type glycerol-3-phosphate transport system substrate-binding protein
MRATANASTARKEPGMRGGIVRTASVVTVALALAMAPPAAWSQSKKLIFWTHWEQNPEFNKFYETRGKDFAQKSGYEVQVVTVPYQGYEAKYLAALIGKSGAPDIFMGMAHHWCGQYDFCDPMPSDLAKTWDENLPRYMMSVGKWKGVRYGTPIEHGNFQQMYLNADLFRKAGLDPDKPPKTLEEWLAAMKKLTVLDAKGEITQAGFALRHKGHPVGITDKFLPFAHAFGARMLSPNLDKATGFANSPEMVAALTFYADLVQRHKVASLSFPTPEDAFGQKRAATIFRESWFFGWVKKNAPDVSFKVYALPCAKTCPGAGNLFPWANMVYKGSPNKSVAWDFVRFISNAKDDLDQHQAQGILPVWTANVESPYVKGRPDYQSTQEMLKQPVPPEYYHPKSNELATAFGEAVVAALYGKGQPKPLLDEAAAKMDRILKD